MTTHNIKFEVSLLPKNSKGIRFDKTHYFRNLEEDYYNVYDYLCNHSQSSYVLNHLTNIYMKYKTITNIQFIKNGIFSCDIDIDHKIKSFELIDYIEGLLWKNHSDLSKTVNVNGKIFNLNISLYYESNVKYSEILDIDDDHEF